MRLEHRPIAGRQHGANRAGDNLFANCLLALKAGTGERAWHFQADLSTVSDVDQALVAAGIAAACDTYAITGRGLEPGTFNWRNKRLNLDVQGEYRLLRQVSAFFNLRNVGAASEEIGQARGDGGEVAVMGGGAGGEAEAQQAVDGGGPGADARRARRWFSPWKTSATCAASFP